jgi:4-amino-4-deoxy-L-arabinose transferase-like glycosyltransferase
MPKRLSVYTPVLLLILVGYLAVGTLYAVKTPAWQVPDEPAHYNYVAQISKQGCCPVIAPGDWDNAYLETIKAAHFAPEALAGRLNTVRYENHQPPLYYLLAAPVFSATNGDLTALRLFSVLIGALVVIVAWATVRVIFPAVPWLAVGTAAFVAFLPQHVVMMAGVNNDPLTELLAGLILLTGVYYIKNEPPRYVAPLMGVLLGLAFWTKLTVYPLAVLPFLAVLLRARRKAWSLQSVMVAWASVLIPALLLGIPFWLHNIATYGGFDILAQAAHDRVVVGQLSFGAFVADNGLGGWLRALFQDTFRSFWGMFGWMGVPMTNAIYYLLLAFTTFVLVGLIIAFARWRKALTPTQWDALILCGAALLMIGIAYLYYNLKFVQFQGRYFYPALIPISLCFAAGLAGWTALPVRAFRARFPVVRWLAPTVMGLFALGLAAFAIYALFRILIPGLPG